MANYVIIGGDGKEYGPVTDADVRQWIVEGRLNAQSRAKAESDAEFRPLSAFPEFADALGLNPDVPPAIRPLKLHSSAPSDSSGGPANPGPFVERDYDLDIGGCLSRGFATFKEHFGLLFVGALIYLLIEGMLGGLANIPFVGPIFSIVNFVISGPLMGGVFYLFIRAVRNETAEVGDVFAGFRRAFGHLFLGTLVQGILIGLCLVPALVVFFIKLFPVMRELSHTTHPSPEQLMQTVMPALISCLPWFFICALPAIYLGTSWKFTLPLIVDREMDFWTAMKTSFKMVNKHWWQVFGLVVLIGLLNIAGLLACCVGMLFTIPIGFAALMHAYETIFSERKN
jgi:uncharacterized membrane protein